MRDLMLVRSPDRGKVAIRTQASGYTTAIAHTVRVGVVRRISRPEHLNYRLPERGEQSAKRAGIRGVTPAELEHLSVSVCPNMLHQAHDDDAEQARRFLHCTPDILSSPHADQAGRNYRRDPRTSVCCEVRRRSRPVVGCRCASSARGASAPTCSEFRGPGPAIIAELKKASPSKGLIRADFKVAELAAELEQAGAAALSVLTDERYFQGSLHNLELASQATAIPCLRKDFIVDEFQLLEARAYRADAILLIVAALNQDELARLYRRARELQLDVLCEVHDAAELDRALEVGCDIIGVNNRNLHTFHVDLNTSLQLAKRIPAGVLKVAESGIESGDDIARLRDAGFDAFLIGESLMRAPSPGEALRSLLGQKALKVN